MASISTISNSYALEVQKYEIPASGKNIKNYSIENNNLANKKFCRKELTHIRLNMNQFYFYNNQTIYGSFREKNPCNTITRESVYFYLSKQDISGRNDLIYSDRINETGNHYMALTIPAKGDHLVDYLGNESRINSAPYNSGLAAHEHMPWASFNGKIPSFARQHSGLQYICAVVMDTNHYELNSPHSPICTTLRLRPSRVIHDFGNKNEPLSLTPVKKPTISNQTTQNNNETSKMGQFDQQNANENIQYHIANNRFGISPHMRIKSIALNDYDAHRDGHRINGNVTFVTAGLARDTIQRNGRDINVTYSVRAWTDIFLSTRDVTGQPNIQVHRSTCIDSQEILNNMSWCGITTTIIPVGSGVFSLNFSGRIPSDMRELSGPYYVCTLIKDMNVHTLLRGSYQDTQQVDQRVQALSRPRCTPIFLDPARIEAPVVPVSQQFCSVGHKIYEGNLTSNNGCRAMLIVELDQEPNGRFQNGEFRLENARNCQITGGHGLVGSFRANNDAIFTGIVLNEDNHQLPINFSGRTTQPACNNIKGDFNIFNNQGEEIEVDRGVFNINLLN
jgi:hypothetical protein